MKQLLVQRRDWWLILGLLGLTFVALLIGMRQEIGDDTPPALTSYSSTADGARALALWLEELDYRMRRLEGISFRPDPQDRLLFVLSPQQAFSSGEVKRVDEWVEAGGTLVLATDAWFADPLLEHFEIGIGFLDGSVDEAGPAQPLLLDPPWGRAEVRTDRYLETRRDDVVVHVVADGRPVLLSFDRGAGRVFVLATTYPFTNAGLRDAGNARLVHSLVATIRSTFGAGARIAFDEFHHGYQKARTLTTWLKTTPQGYSLIYAGLVIFFYLLIGGRRFGRPLSMSRSATRRAPIEHVRAMANLFRRGGKRTAILHHYHDRLKRELARPHHLDPMLPDVDFVNQLGIAAPELNLATLSRLLEKTARERVSEGELIELAQEVDDWTSRKS